jgi:hypothetical protein
MGDQWRQTFYCLDGVCVGLIAAEELNLPTIAFCTAICKIHVRQFVKQLTIRTVLRQYSKWKNITLRTVAILVQFGTAQK